MKPKAAVLIHLVERDVLTDTESVQGEVGLEGKTFSPCYVECLGCTQSNFLKRWGSVFGLYTQRPYNMLISFAPTFQIACSRLWCAANPDFMYSNVRKLTIIKCYISNQPSDVSTPALVSPMSRPMQLIFAEGSNILPIFRALIAGVRSRRVKVEFSVTGFMAYFAIKYSVVIIGSSNRLVNYTYQSQKELLYNLLSVLRRQK